MLSALQHTATHCNTLQHTATHCNTLQHTAAHCSTLQHTATHCNTLQHTHHMTGVLSALSRGCRAWHFPHCRHTTTGFVNHTPTILYPGINLYLRKFWLEISKLSQVQICSQVQDCWRMVHKTSCIMHYNGEMLSKTAPAECRQHTNYAMSVLQCVLQWVLQC